MIRPGHLLALLLGPAALAGCSLTPIPDVTSEWSEPCETSLRRCTREFTLRATTEKSVELRGSFRSDGWTRGEPMQKVAETWVTTVTVAWGGSVQYKFFVDGTTWMLDPANAATGTTGGVTNSLIDNVTCAKWTCLSPSGG